MPFPYSADIWLPSYFLNRVSRLSDRHTVAPKRVWVAITDHFEPFGDRNTQRSVERVAEWRRKWPEIASRCRDDRGVPAQYTFFYPAEEYRPELLDLLAEMAHAGYGDVEIHLHHDRDGEAAFIDRVSNFKQTLLERHDLLRKVNGRIVFGFIHGNWALDNSRPDGRWCGLNHELQLLRDLDCYADFTMPCGPAPMQSRMLNTIYWATDDPRLPKSYDRGQPALPGKGPLGDLLMIVGPFGLRWRERLKPRFEIGELAGYDRVTPYRVSRWLDLAPRLGEDIFIKLFTHGAQERNSSYLLNGGLDFLFTELKRQCGDRGLWLSHATAWQMHGAIAGMLQPAPHGGSLSVFDAKEWTR